MVNKNIVSLFVEDASSVLDNMEIPFWYGLEFSKREDFKALENYFEDLYTAWATLDEFEGPLVKDLEREIRDSVTEAKKIVSKDPRVALMEIPDTVYAVVRKGKVVLTFDMPADTVDYIVYER